MNRSIGMCHNKQRKLSLVLTLPSVNRIRFHIDVIWSLKENDLLFAVRELRNKAYAKLTSVKLSFSHALTRSTHSIRVNPNLLVYVLKPIKTNSQ